MKIQSDKLRLKSKINEFYQERRYQDVILLKDDILVFSFEEEDISVFEKIIISSFVLDEYLEVIAISSKLNNVELESYIIIYYTCLSFIALINFYQANLFITSSKLLSDAYHKLLYASDGANYSNILTLDNKNSIYALVMVNFVLGLSKEATRDNNEVNQEYIFYRVMDLLNVLVELNYPEEIVNKIYKDFKKIYKI